MDQQTLETTIEAVVCVPTFRRPDWLLRTLTSLKDQNSDIRFAIVVVDNDGKNPAGADVARSYLTQANLPHAVFVEKEQGNCHAINRAFGEARASFPKADFFLMIDDDEVASPDWLNAIIDLAKREDADIVGGPVLRQFETPVSDNVKHHPLFQSIDGPSRRLDQIHGTGNCLIRRRVFDNLTSPEFDLRYNFMGGGDMDFFTRCRKAGFSTWWCETAIAYEFVPQDRTTPGFLMTRSIRTGSINYVIDRVHELSATQAFMKNLISLGLSFFRSAKLLFRTRSLLIATHPVLMSVGRIHASIGSLPEPYKAGNTQESSNAASKQNFSV